MCDYEQVRVVQKDLEAALKEAKFWKAQCEGQARDIKKLVEQIQELGGVPKAYA